MTAAAVVPPLDRSSPLPLWAQLRLELRRRAAAGEFATAFPGELALVQDYGVSRHTVREALRALRAEGTVVAGRGRAPRLATPVEIEQPLGSLYSLFNSVEQAGLAQRSVVRGLDVRADGVVAARLGLEESTPLLYLERLRLAGEEALALDRAWLPASLGAALLDADFTRTSLYAELAARAGVRLTGGREWIGAAVPSPAEQALLGLETGVALLAVDRLGCAGGRPVEWRHTIVRADRFWLSATFSGREGYRLDAARLGGMSAWAKAGLPVDRGDGSPGVVA